MLQMGAFIGFCPMNNIDYQNCNTYYNFEEQMLFESHTTTENLCCLWNIF